MASGWERVALAEIDGLSALLKNLAVGSSALLVTLLAAEALLRLSTPPSFRQQPFEHVASLRIDPVRGWRNVPGRYEPGTRIAGLKLDEWLVLNSRGLRGPELEVPKPPALVRIVCLGDSGTFGLWKRADAAGVVGLDSYALELGSILRQRGRSDVEVVNAGVLGYSSIHGLRQLQLEILELEPDVVTVRFGYNDHTPAWQPELRVRDPSQPWLRAVFHHLAGWRLMRLGLSAYRSWGWLHPEPWSVPWVSRQEFERTLRRFAALGREHGFRLLFIDYPLAPLELIDPGAVAYFLGLTRTGSASNLYGEHETYQAILEKVSTEEGVPLLESAPLLRDQAGALFSPIDLVHPNDEGARVLARLLLRQLDALGWLEANRGAQS